MNRGRCISALLAVCAVATPAIAQDNGSIDIAVVVYDGALTSDVIAPLEVFGIASKLPWFKPIHVEAVSVDDDLDIRTEEGIRLTADRLVADAPAYDAIIVPSSYDMKQVLSNESLRSFVSMQRAHAKWLTSNCSGAQVLAASGALDGKRATTWAGGEAAFARKFPAVDVQYDTNVVVDDGVITSNGSIVSYEGALLLLENLTNEAFAGEVANDLQFSRIVDAKVPARLNWGLASLFASSGVLIGAMLVSLLAVFLTRKKRA